MKTSSVPTVNGKRSLLSRLVARVDDQPSVTGRLPIMAIRILIDEGGAREEGFHFCRYGCTSAAAMRKPSCSGDASGEASRDAITRRSNHQYFAWKLLVGFAVQNGVINPGVTSDFNGRLRCNSLDGDLQCNQADWRQPLNQQCRARVSLMSIIRPSEFWF
jgi:hypothetical protein